MPIDYLISYFGPGDECTIAEIFAKEFFGKPRIIDSMTKETHCFTMLGDASVYRVEADPKSNAFHVSRIFIQMKVTV